MYLGRKSSPPAWPIPTSGPTSVQMIDVGVNWYLNKFVKIYFDWEHAIFGNPSSPPYPSGPISTRERPVLAAVPGLLLIAADASSRACRSIPALHEAIDDFGMRARCRLSRPGLTAAARDLGFERRRRSQRDPERELGLVVVHQRADEIHAGLGEQRQAVEHFDGPPQVLAAARQVFLEAELGRSELVAWPRAIWLCAACASASEARDLAAGEVDRRAIVRRRFRRSRPGAP